MFALGGLLLAGLAFFAMVFAFIAVMFKAVIWMLVLPFRLIGWAIGAVVMLIGTAIAIVAGLAIILAPLVPVAILAGLAYGIYRLVRRPVAA